MNDGQDDDSIPLQDQRIFGAGIKRKRIKFIRPEGTSTSTPLQPSPVSTVSDRYLSIVLKKPTSSVTPTKDSPGPPITAQNSTQSLSSPSPPIPLCTICNLPFLPKGPSSFLSARPHEASLAHQVCLTHSYPPSHLDRTRPGLKYLTSYGWDPDSRLGLGVTGDGIRNPIMAKAKNNTVGLGINVGKQKGKRVMEKRVEKLDAKKVRKMEEVGRRKGERLKEMFYRNEDVERYLGGEA